MSFGWSTASQPVSKKRKPAKITLLEHHDPFVPAPDVYWVTIYERDDPTRSITALLGDTTPTPSNGGGGWQQVTLPKRSAVTVWQARDQLLQLDVPIVLGTMIGGRPLNVDKNDLIHMWRPADATDEPPVVRLKQRGSAVPFTRLSWVVTDLQWGDAQADNRAQRLLQKLTVVLTEFRADEEIQTVKHAVKKKAKKKAKKHKAKKGETLRKIAAKYQVDGGWQELGQAQVPVLRDPNQVLVGQELLIP
jgi:LysM repeat protein